MTDAEQGPGAPSWLKAETVTRMSGSGTRRRPPVPPSRLGRPWLVLAMLLAALVGVAIAQPWSEDASPAPSPSASTPTATVAASPTASTAVATTAASPSPRPSAMASPRPARMLVRSIPTGATVLVDGTRKGRTPLEVRGQPNRETRVEVKRDGFRRFVSVLRLEPGRTSRVMARLERASKFVTRPGVAAPSPPAASRPPAPIPPQAGPAAAPPRATYRPPAAAPPRATYRPPAAAPPRATYRPSNPPRATYRPPVRVPPATARVPARNPAPPVVSTPSSGGEAARQAEARRRYEAARRIQREEELRRKRESGGG